MSIYTAPLRDMRFILEEVAGLDQISTLPGCEEVTPDMLGAILEELNRVGDTQGCTLEGGK